MALDVINPVSLKKLVHLGGFSFVDGDQVDNVDTWRATLIDDQITGGGVWDAKTDSPISRFYHRMNQYQPDMFILGGIDTSSFTPVLGLTKYSTSNDSYTPIAAVDGGDGIPSARAAFASGMIGQTLFMIGGSVDGTNPVDECWSVDVTTGVWSQLSSIPSGAPVPSAGTPMASGAMASGDFDSNDKFYIYGGNVGAGESTGAVLEYDPSLDAWDTSRTGWHSLFGNEIVIINNYLYSISGQDVTGVLNYTSRYDIDTDTWVDLTPIPIARHAHTVAVVNGKIYVFGGLDGFGAPLSDGWQYDPSTDTWIEFTTLPSNMFSASSGVYNSKIYINSAGDMWELSPGEVKQFAVKRFY